MSLSQTVITNEPTGDLADQAQARLFQDEVAMGAAIQNALRQFGGESICWEGIGFVSDDIGLQAREAYIVVVNHLINLSNDASYTSMVEYIALSRNIAEGTEVVIASQDSTLGRTYCQEAQ